VAQNIGDAAKAMAGAAAKVEATYQVPFLAHATMEPMNCTVHVRRDGCEVWVGTQALSRAQAAAAKVLGLTPDKVLVHNHLLGAASAAGSMSTASCVRSKSQNKWMRP
jgi:isoquinoline 1-oxidoreductase beta subunit